VTTVVHVHRFPPGEEGTHPFVLGNGRFFKAKYLHVLFRVSRLTRGSESYLHISLPIPFLERRVLYLCNKTLYRTKLSTRNGEPKEERMLRQAEKKHRLKISFRNPSSKLNSHPQHHVSNTAKQGHDTDSHPFPSVYCALHHCGTTAECLPDRTEYASDLFHFGARGHGCGSSRRFAKS
jgi:hypothetical protein